MIVPIITTVIAFIAGGLIVLRDRPQPVLDLPGDLQRDRPELAVPVGHRGRARRSRPATSSRRCSQATPLILTGLAVAFAFRAGLFNIGAQGQYTVGAVIAVWIGSSFNGMKPVLHIVFAIVAAALRRRRCGRGSPGS